MTVFKKMQFKIPVSFIKSAGIIIVWMFIGVISLNAQNIQIKGTVTDATTKEPLPGVNIIVEGTTIGVTTNLDGQYSISVPSQHSMLVFSYISYLTERISVEGKTEINIALAPDIKTIDEVVVIGYGSIKKKDLTGAVSSIGGEKLKDIPITSAAEALTGKLAGVQITTTEGSPDAEIKIRVRGGGSITQDNSPLYIVDGFPVSSISNISPSDIATIDVLKDASSTAIYGSRGANGVIIVTTKTAKEGKITVNYNGYYGVKKLVKKIDVLPVKDFVLWQYEQALLQGNLQTQYEDYYGAFVDYDLYSNVKGNDWQDQILGRIGNSSSHSISASGGTEKVQFNFNFNRNDEKAIMINSSYARNNLNFKLNANPTQKITIGLSARYSDTEIVGSGANEQNERSSSDSRLKNIITYTPIPLKRLDIGQGVSDDEEYVGSLFPPTTFIYDNDRLQERKNLNFGAHVSWELIKGLKLRSEIGSENDWDDDNRFYGLSTYYVRDQAAYRNRPAVIFTNSNSATFRNANTATFELKNVGVGHNASFMVGQEVQITQSKTLTTNVQNLPETFSSERAFKLTTVGTAFSTENFYSPDNLLSSFFGRVNYDLNGKYLLSATYRVDGSSKFAAKYKWGYFPSIALGWRISDESFLDGIEWLDNLKLRVSYGAAGNNRIPSGLTSKTYSSDVTAYLSTATSYWSAGSTLNNEFLKWETTYTRNIGLDYGIFKNKFNGTIEVYFNNTVDLLLPLPVYGTGYSVQYQNVGKTSNKGIEFTLNGSILNKKNIDLNFSFNIGFNKNKVEDLSELNRMPGQSGWTSEIVQDYIVMEGKPVGTMYGYVTAGRYGVDEFTWDGTEWIANSGVVDNSTFAGASWGPGALKLADLNPDGEITPEDMTIIGDANPIHTGGFSLSGRILNFDFNANFNWSYGNDVYNANKIEFTSTSKYNNRNMIALMASGNRWTNIDADGNRVTDHAELAALNANTTLWSPLISRYIFHSWAVEDGSFLRLNNLTIGYSLPKKILNGKYINDLRFYVTGYNLLCLTNYTGYDPEADTRRRSQITPGVDYAAYPRSRSLIFGVNLSF